MKISRLALLMMAVTAWAAAAESGRRPNIVFILGDDLGYGDLGCYGQKQLATPHLDRLADSGMRFTQHYAGNASCSPSRSSFLPEHLERPAGCVSACHLAPRSTAWKGVYARCRLMSTMWWRRLESRRSVGVRKAADSWPCAVAHASLAAERMHYYAPRFRSHCALTPERLRRRGRVHETCSTLAVCGRTGSV